MVDPIKLPPCIKPIDGYPWVALDGASGTGKTQQAFALLNAGYDVIYYLPGKGYQNIYEEMELRFPSDELEASLQHLQTILLERQNSLKTDVFSLNYLRARTDTNTFSEAVQTMQKAVLTTEVDEKGINQIKRKTVKDLSGVVFFIDEAIPQDEEKADTNRNHGQ